MLGIGQAVDKESEVMPSIYCQNCGRELLDRPSFRELPLCLRCRFQGAIFDPNVHPVKNNIYGREITVRRREVRVPETKFVKEVRREMVRRPTAPRITDIQPSQVRETTKLLEVEGDESLVAETLDEIEKIEGIKKVKKE